LGIRGRGEIMDYGNLEEFRDSEFLLFIAKSGANYP
jgi:hypothetical protein